MTQPSVSHRLHDQLGQIIATITPGGRLPSEPELAEHLSVSRATLREAMRTFETQGIIRRRQGSGTFVNLPPHVLESGLELLESIERIALRSGLSVNMGDLKVDRRNATDEETNLLSLDETKEVMHISRVIMAEDRPVAYLIDILPVNILTPRQLEDGFTGSILDLLIQQYESTVLSSRTEINAVTANSQVARALGIQRGDVLLNFIADLYTKDGQTIDHSVSYFLPGYFRFHVVRRIG